MSESSIIYTVSATQARVASFPNTDAVRIGKNRYVPSLKVLLSSGNDSSVMAIPVIVQEVTTADEIEAVRAAMHNKVNMVCDELLAKITQGGGE